MKISCLLFVFFIGCSLNPFAQNDAEIEKYNEDLNQIILLFQNEEYLAAKKKAEVLYQSNLDSSLVFEMWLATTIFNENLENEVFDEEEYIAPYSAILDEKFTNSAVLTNLICMYYNQMDMHDFTIERLEKLPNITDRIDNVRLLLEAYHEMAETLKYTELLSSIQKNAREDKVYADVLLRFYMDNQFYQEARILNDEMLLSMNTSAEDYLASAFIHFHLGEKFEACEDLKMAKRKGYSGNESWIEGLNCENKDLSDQDVVKFDNLHKLKLDLQQGEQEINRENWRPTLKKLQTFEINEELVKLETVHQRKTQGFAYFLPNDGPAFGDNFLRTLCLYTNPEMEAYNLPNILKKGEVNTCFQDGKSTLEITYLCAKELTLFSKETILCDVIRVSALRDTYLMFVAYHYFSKNRGWIGSESIEEKIFLRE